MRWLFLFLIATTAQAQNHLDRHNYIVNLEATGFTAQQRGSEYFYEVEIISNYGTLAVAQEVDGVLTRLLALQEEFRGGKIYGAPLLHWFYTVDGEVDRKGVENFKKQLEKKIEGLRELQVLCQALHSNALFRAASERVKFDGKQRSGKFQNVEFSLGEILTMFRVTELVEAVAKVTPLPELDSIGTPIQAKKGVLEKFEVPFPKLLWTIRLLQKDPGSKPKVIQEMKAAADIRPNLDSIEYSPLYASVASRNGFQVRASIKRDIEAGRSCFAKVVGF